MAVQLGKLHSTLMIVSTTGLHEFWHILLLL
jgi:hypothetical protein